MWNKICATHATIAICLISISIAFCACAISYKFNGAAIDYQTTKTISIANFPNQAPLVYPLLSNNLSEAIRDQFDRQTRLQILPRDGQLQLEGEIIGYEVTGMSIGSDNYAQETKLTITVRVRYTNTINPEDSFEKTYSVYQTFDASRTLNDVQDELCELMVKEIAESIFNDTVAKW